MACAGCTIDTKDGKPTGCKSNGSCSTGGCNRLNTYDWLAAMDIEDVEPFNIVEVSFKNGARKAFFYNQPFTRANTGDTVVVESQAGFDVGRISLSGELVRLQMRKKRVPIDGFFPKVVRKANERDLEKLDEVRQGEKAIMVRARAIARTLDLNMKIGDVEFQGDGKKATFYYTADGRVDFRELIRHFAKEFKVKIEMRQIGARQESARIGGIGPCGRELCCSTWLTSYRTVSTAAARYQNLAINQAKLSGQCGRLKCCLNYELDTYMEALSNFPEDAERLRTKRGLVVLVKTDIFKGLMYYSYEQEAGRGRMYPLDLTQVRSVREMNKRGEFPPDLEEMQVAAAAPVEEEHGYGDVTGVVELPPDDRRRKKKKNKPGPDRRDGRERRPDRPQQQAKDRLDAPPPTQQPSPEAKAQQGPTNPPKQGRDGGGGRDRGRNNNRSRGKKGRGDRENRDGDKGGDKQ